MATFRSLLIARDQINVIGSNASKKSRKAPNAACESDLRS